MTQVQVKKKTNWEPNGQTPWGSQNLYGIVRKLRKNFLVYNRIRFWDRTNGYVFLCKFI